MNRLAAIPTRVLLAIALLALIAVIAVIFASQQQLSISAPTQQMMTIDPRVIANMTALPKATPLSGQDANDLNNLKQAVDACPDYTDARRQQMDEQIEFIIDPSALTSDIILALGANPRGQLLTAIGQVTANQWQLLNKPPNSCLIPIGERINQMLVAAEEPPIAVFTGG